MKNKCIDCRHYLPVDVFKGMCRKNKETISADNSAPESCFEKNKKCKYCANFSYDKDRKDLGLCMGKTVAYPDMTALTCKMYKDNSIR